METSPAPEEANDAIATMSQEVNTGEVRSQVGNWMVTILDMVEEAPCRTMGVPIYGNRRITPEYIF